MNKYARLRYQPCLPLGNDGRRVTACDEHIALSRQAAAEGMVLLKNKNNALPLPNGAKLALFGKASIEYIKGGGGSGDVYPPFVANVYDGFRQKGERTAVYEPLIDFYRQYVQEEQKNVLTDEQINATWDIVNAMEFCQKRDDMTYDTFNAMHVKEAAVPDELIDAAAAFADTAIVTLSRFSAEGTDRRPIPGDYYLSDLERDLLDRVGARFDKVIVVLNSGAVLDCEYLAENEQVDAILLGWQGGMAGGAAIADVLCGDVCPCGKLPDTITRSYDAYPSKSDFTEDMHYVNYTDDIYVGYRYFATIPGAAQAIRYPFGFGLSYTTFSLDGIVCGESDGVITAAVRVTNTGVFSGREVVQLYYSAPQGKLGKPALQLAAFAKTKQLVPGESETVALSFAVNSMASFDDLGKIAKSAYVLEKGEYAFFLGTSSADANKLAFVYTVSEDRVTEQLSQLCRPFRLPRRLLADGSYESLPMGEEHHANGAHAASCSEVPNDLVRFDDVGQSCTMAEFVSQFTDEELMDFVGGQPPTGVANTGCFGGLKRLDVPAAATADGPAGLRLAKDTGIPTTAWPCATLLAATWDVDLIYRVGRAAAMEIRENNIGIWLAPAMNIHRDPLCGRNFEYYSEDPLLAGKSAAAAVRGIQSTKVAVSLKHFACNNKEVNRYGSDSRLSERALREIYLKGFEIAVKEADPWTIMTSYNLINGQHTSENYELITGILRGEWGFRGMVETDWGVKNDPVQEVLAGNDMKMPVGYPEDLKAGLLDGRLTRGDLEVCVIRILQMIEKLAE